jgi:hypothetical protein
MLEEPSTEDPEIEGSHPAANQHRKKMANFYFGRRLQLL